MTSKTDLTNLGEVVETDVLIIGGGVAGLIATIRAKLARPAVSVLMVDKATPGFAGQAAVTGGWSGFPPEEQLDEWFKERVEQGVYLNDQEVTYAFSKAMRKVVMEMADWGAPLDRDEKGKLIVNQTSPTRRVVHWASVLGMTNFLRGKARSEGARILPRIFVVELLTEGERVAGAVGFSFDSGQFYILKAKATILANGACMYRYRPVFRHNHGDGVAMAYNVGAELRDAEFANTVTGITKDGLRGCRLAFEDAVNAKGEKISERYGIKNTRDFTIMAPIMYKEIQEGRGPIYTDEGAHYEHGGYDRNVRIREALGIPRGQRVELIFGLNGRQGSIRVDSHCRTTLPGLWAVGDASYGGSSFLGAVAPCSVPPSGIPFAKTTGYIAGPDAADFAAEAAAPQIDSSQVSRLKEQVYAPLKRKAGFDPNDAIYQVQEAILPTKYNVFRSGERMQEALAMIEKVKGRLPTLWAKDLHYLVKAHEAASMAFCAEITYRPALMRQESRGFHMREDYPERDDQNWLKWIIIKKEKEEMKLWTEPVPIDKYKIKPPKKA
ncbi:FAD-binding protein [Chloroflexota bacterium]